MYNLLEESKPNKHVHKYIEENLDLSAVKPVIKPKELCKEPYNLGKRIKSLWGFCEENLN